MAWWRKDDKGAGDDNNGHSDEDNESDETPNNEPVVPDSDNGDSLDD